MTRRGMAIELAVLTGLGVLLALLGPFGTFAMPWPLRLLDWLFFMLGGALFFRPVIGAARVLSRHGAMRLPVGMLCACLLAAFPTTLLVTWCMAGMGWRHVTVEALASLYPEVLLIGGVATLLQFAIATRRQPNQGAPDPSASPPREPLPEVPPCMTAVAGDTPGAAEADEAGVDGGGADAAGPVATTVWSAAFLSRLPPSLGRDLLCLENEDHYVRAHTSCGSTLILMRLADAVAELDGVDGLRIHRSWWVARGAVNGIVRRERSIGLCLSNGIEAPVARTMVPVLRQAGWLVDGDAARGMTAAAPAPAPAPAPDAPA